MRAAFFFERIREGKISIVLKSAVGRGVLIDVSKSVLGKKYARTLLGVLPCCRAGSV